MSPQAKEPSGVVPSWQRDLKKAWYADTGPRKPRFTLSFPYNKLSFHHGQRVNKEGSAEKICVNTATGHKGIYLVSSAFCVLGTNIRPPLCIKVYVHGRVRAQAHLHPFPNILYSPRLRTGYSSQAISKLWYHLIF